MKSLAYAALLVWVGVLVACVSRGEIIGKSKPVPMFDLSIMDNILEQQFELLLRSSDSRLLCFDIEQWPNRIGAVESGGQRAVLKSKEGVFPAADANFGYCPDGCGTITVEPGMELLGVIPYSQFGKPDEIAKLHGRQLIFTVMPRVCAK